MFGRKKKEKECRKFYKTDLERLIEDFIVCICHFYRGAKPPFVKTFKDDYYYWIDTEVGLIELDNIPHDNTELSERCVEIECLIADNSWINDEIIEKLNEEIKNRW